MKITPIEAEWIKDNIKKVDFLSLLSDSQIQNLIDQASPRIVMGNQFVIREGQHGESFFFIYNGRVSVKIERSGKQTKLANLKNGDYFGEISLLTGKPATANVMATAPTKVFFLNSEQFVDLVRSNKELTKHILEVMKKRLKERKEAIEALQYGNLDELSQAISEFLGTSKPE